jgi:ABC-type transport system involved in cytochrome c biogenesis permease subunit
MRYILITLLFFLCSGTLAASEKITSSDTLNYSIFSNIPVVHEGRLKSLESFARSKFNTISAHQLPGDKTPIALLALALFDPGKMHDAKIFYIKKPSLKRQLGLDETAADYFSLADLNAPLKATEKQALALLKTPPAQLTADQKEFLKIHDSAIALMQIMRSFSMILPLNIEIPKTYAAQFPDPSEVNFKMLYAVDADLRARMKSIVSKKGENPKAFSDEEKKLAMMGFQMDVIRSAGAQNSVFKIMPALWGKAGADKNWISPWETMLSGQGSPQMSEYLDLWQKAALAYREGNSAAWNEEVKALYAHIENNADFSPFRFVLEDYYHLINPYSFAIAFYLLAGMAALALKPRWAGILTLAGIAFHLCGIAARIIILDRPPVGTLYESVLFVALICAAAGLWFAHRRAMPSVLFPANIGAAALLFLAPAILPQGESLEILSAVLNTNFWLGTHVIIITAGYGFCILCALMAHFALMRMAFFKGADIPQHLIHALSIIALLLTTVGTVLGGIWADQSWGRFWGWDPKENGALLIVLWLVWAQHGRLSKHLSPLLYLIALGALNIVVALAWFGVNLLNVGLHSYGFTSGLATGLGLFCALEILVLGSLWFLIVKKNRASSAHAA